MRPSWDETFVEVVRIYEKRSTCLRFQVGAVFVRNRRILTAGYNGVPKGESHCIDIGCAKKNGQDWCSGAHAEMNAVCNAATEGIDLSQATLYCSFSPCMSCAKQLVNLEIRKIVYLHDYKKDNGEGESAIALLKRAGVDVTKIQQ